MSHFSTIKTSIKELPPLLKALEVLNYEYEQDADLVITNPDHAEDHPVVQAQVSVAKDIGFRWNKVTETYDLYADNATWDLDVPVQRFLDKVTQRYAEAIVLDTIGKMGYEVEDKKTTVDNKIELVCAKWL